MYGSTWDFEFVRKSVFLKAIFNALIKVYTNIYIDNGPRPIFPNIDGFFHLQSPFNLVLSRRNVYFNGSVVEAI